MGRAQWHPAGRREFKPCAEARAPGASHPARARSAARAAWIARGPWAATQARRPGSSRGSRLPGIARSGHAAPTTIGSMAPPRSGSAARRGAHRAGATARPADRSPHRRRRPPSDRRRGARIPPSSGRQPTARRAATGRVAPPVRRTARARPAGGRPRGAGRSAASASTQQPSRRPGAATAGAIRTGDASCHEHRPARGPPCSLPVKSGEGSGSRSRECGRRRVPRARTAPR